MVCGWVVVGRYLFAVAMVALATFVRVEAVDPVLAGRVPFPVYFAAMIAAVWIGGVGPGLLAAILGYVAVLALMFASGQHFSPAYHTVLALLYWGVCGGTLVLAERLRQARVRAEADAAEAERGRAALMEGDRRKDEFLATLAHELRNPLAPIRSSLDVMKLGQAQPAELVKAREVMERQVRHLCRLVDDLMDISRITRGKISLRKQWVDLASVVEDALETSGPLLDKAGADLRVSLPPERVWIFADPTRLAQVLSNLLNNAARFTSTGAEVEIEARLEGEHPSEQQAVLYVRDSGAGIPADQLPKIFDLFGQGPSECLPGSTGLGIGLHLVRKPGRAARRSGGGAQCGGGAGQRVRGPCATCIRSRGRGPGGFVRATLRNGTADRPAPAPAAGGR